MGKRKTWSLVALGSCVLATGLYVYMRMADGEKPAQTQQSLGLRPAVVVTSADDAARLLAVHPNMVVIGTQGVAIRPSVPGDEAYRVIETDTERGWVHIVKHLRPSTVLLADGLGAAEVKGFVGAAVPLTEALATGHVKLS